MDLRKTIEAKSDQLNADDLVGGSKTIKIREVNVIDSETQPVSIFFEGDNNKPYKPSKGMRRALIAIWGAESDVFKGRYLTLFRDENVKFGGSEVGGIRISHASNIDKPERVLETVSRGKRKPFTIEPLVIKKKIMKDANAAKKAIDSGKYTFEQLDEMYDLTEEQKQILNEKTAE